MTTKLSAVTTTGTLAVVFALCAITLACPFKWQPPRQTPRPTSKPTTTTSRPQTAAPTVPPTARIFYISTSISDPVRDWFQAAAGCEAYGLRLPSSLSMQMRMGRIHEFLNRLDDVDGTLPDTIGFWRWSETADPDISCPAVLTTRSTNVTDFDAMEDCTDLLHGFICEGSIDLNMAANMGSIWCDSVCAIFFE